jgi:hypothetical protein
MSKTSVTIEVSDKMRIPKSALPAKTIKVRYDKHVYLEAKCEKCENLPDRHNEACDDCPAFVGHYRFFSKEEAKNGVWALPQGDLLALKSKLEKTYDHVKVVDKRIRVPFSNKIRFTGTLFKKGDVYPNGSPAPDQERVVTKWLSKGTGAIQAAPRTGKTVMATYLYCELGMKTVIIANQKEFLKQFYETATGMQVPKFRGDKRIGNYEPSKGRKSQTNIHALQLKTDKEIIRFVDKFSQLENAEEDYDVILITYQALLRDPTRIVKYLNGKYSFCIVDEEHQGSAEGYLKVLARLNMAARCSLSATTERKDLRSTFGRLILGPVVARSTTNALVPQVIMQKTGFDIQPALKSWPGSFKRLVFDKNRNKLIVDTVFKDLRDGHKVIIIPVDYTSHMEGLVKMINKRAETYFEKLDEDWPIELAKSFWSKSDRDAILKWVDSTKWDCPNPNVSKKERGTAPRVLVAIRSMIKQGVDMSRPTALYSVLPLSATQKTGAPLFYQMANRVCTPVPNKKNPIVRVFVDEVGMFKGCANGLFWNEIYKNSTIVNVKGRYHVDKRKLPEYKALLSKKKKPNLGASSWF